MSNSNDVGLFASNNFNSIKYNLFSWQHIVVIILSFLILFAATVILIKRKVNFLIVLRVLAVIVSACLICLVAYSIIFKEYNLEWYLPLHLCNLFFIVLPIAATETKAYNLFADFIVWCGIGGFFAQTLFPITTVPYYSPFHFVSLIISLHHLCIGLAGVLFVASGQYKNFNAFKLLPIIYILALFALPVNYYTNSNFMFLNKSRSLGVFPLELVYKYIPLNIWMLILGVTVISIILHVVTNKKLKLKLFKNNHSIKHKTYIKN